MMLKGKCKKDFEKWLLNWIGINIAWKMEIPTKEDAEHFYTFPQSMQYGVYVDFFESVGFILDIHPILDYDKISYTKVVSYVVNVIKLKKEIKFDHFIDAYTRKEARKLAIQKANEIYNKYDI